MKKSQQAKPDRALRLKQAVNRMHESWVFETERLLTRAGVPKWVEVEGVAGNTISHRLEWFLARRKDVSEAERSGVLPEMNEMESASEKAREQDRAVIPIPLHELILADRDPNPYRVGDRVRLIERRGDLRVTMIAAIYGKNCVLTDRRAGFRSWKLSDIEHYREPIHESIQQ